MSNEVEINARNQEAGPGAGRCWHVLLMLTGVVNAGNCWQVLTGVESCWQRIDTSHCSNLILNSKTKSEASGQRGIKNLTFNSLFRKNIITV